MKSCRVALLALFLLALATQRAPAAEPAVFVPIETYVRSANAGDRAKLVAAFTARIHGKPAKETGSLAFALRKIGPRWKIAAMAWAKLTDTSGP